MLESYADYNHWANQRLVSYFTQQDKEILTKQASNSFPSVLATFLHIWDAQQIWLSRLQGVSPTFFPSREFKGSALEALEGVLKNSLDFQHFIQSRSEKDHKRVVHYYDTKGNQYAQTAEQIVLHCLNHSTYHRGQLISIAHQFGLSDLPATDYIAYLREKSSLDE